MFYGLIAGNGRFPFLTVAGARRAGVRLAVAAIKEETDKALVTEVERAGGVVEWIGLGQLGKMIRFFRRHQIERAIMAGQVKHVQIFSTNSLPDARMLKMLLSLKHRNTDALIGAVADELAKDNIELIASTTFLEDHLPQTGVLTRRAPDKQEQANIAYGLEVAREIARLDLGQTIVVRAAACIAIEAMEGTDAVIKRAGELARGRLTVVKTAKPNQDMRFDVPVVGVPTINAMLEAHATCLCLTAGKTLLFDCDEMIRLADKNKIAIVAV